MSTEKAETETSKAETTAELVHKLLPTCQRCRKLRRKCDTRLPDCRLCEKANVECTFFDHALQQSLPRAYVQSLLSRLESLKAAKAESALSPSSRAAIANARHHQRSISLDESNTLHFNGEEQSTLLPDQNHVDPFLGLTQPATPTFDFHFKINQPDISTRFFGASSVFALSSQLLHFAISTGLISKEEAVTPASQQQPWPDLETHMLSYEPSESIQSYVNIYLKSSNVLYGIVDSAITEHQDLPAYLALRGSALRPEELHGKQSYQYFRIGMMCAIACATKARYRSELAVKSLAFYEDVLPCVEEVTSEVSPQSLQALLLLTVFCLFWPTKGDIWKLLDYCCRLSIELGYHTEQIASMESEDEKRVRRSSFWGLYAIERIVGQLFGRSSDVTEAIVTSEYPEAFGQATNGDHNASSVVNTIPIGQHYRLVYLRSEIFNQLYMPAEPAKFDLAWYQNNFKLLQSWRNELNVPLPPNDVAAATCDVGYHATICFLFQRLMLSAFKDGESDASPEPIPQDNYHSAVDMLQTYSRALQAPEDSDLSFFPITFLSAHYIYLASLTIMSHAVLALSARTQDKTSTLKSLNNISVFSPETEMIDFRSGFWQASNTALVLLARCSERFPGMQGMLDVYKTLADRVLPGMVRNGLL